MNSKQQKSRRIVSAVSMLAVTALWLVLVVDIWNRCSVYTLPMVWSGLLMVGLLAGIILCLRYVKNIEIKSQK